MKTKTILLTILISSLIIFTNSCEKRYPKDIPIWVKNKIKQIEKRKWCNELPISVQEYKNNSTNDVVFVFTKPCPKCQYEIYDYYGNQLCIMPVILDDFKPCGGIFLSDYSFTRNIWSEKCN